jgi:predicted DCC family thiol-disulfide oxidoreductase YuxK
MSYPSLESWILYDGECPFCRSYVKFQNLKSSIGPVKLVNARDGGPEMQVAMAAGLNLDEGMVLFYGGELYHGAACIHMLALLSEKGNITTRFIAWLFGSRSRSGLLYPFLRLGRNLTLRILGRRKLDGSLF